MSRTTVKLARTEDLYDDLENYEWSTLLDSGSLRRVATAPDGTEYDAWIDLDGLWISDPMGAGYVSNVAGWTVELHY